ncbi:MAG: hypothetical protein FJX54_22605 [Alphaproteobacteria bacterium]|nr:hypothetical protein [Alphaproteobacteria bacterium]
MDLDAIEVEIYRSVLFSLRAKCTFAERARIADLFSELVSRQLPPTVFPPLEPWAAALSQSLGDDGCCTIQALLSQDQAAELRRHFDARPCFNAHVVDKSDGVPRRRGEGAETFHYGSYPLADILDAPYLLEVANHPQILAVAAKHLGCIPTLYSLNAWWSFGGHGKAAPESQTFHRDMDDFRFCTLFIYLTDVGQEGGPHMFVRRSHRQDLIASYLADSEAFRRLPEAMRAGIDSEGFFNDGGYGLDPVIETVLAPLIATLTGPAGTGILANTTAFHKGLPPSHGDRLIFWSRYGIHRANGRSTDAQDWSRIGDRLPKTDLLRYVNRVILRSTAAAAVFASQ